MARFPRRITFAAVLAASFFVIALARNSGQDPNALSEQIGKLRSMPDGERAVATKNLALQIRRLPAGQPKIGLASSLANLSTEGDFGRGTLQAVTDTLAAALGERPTPESINLIFPEYMQLAQLARYEHMKVELKDPMYAAALSKLGEIQTARENATFTLQDITGKNWTLSSLKGKVVLVNFWATWCPPCRQEMPDLEILSSRFKDKGLVILAISDETMDKVQPFIAQHKFTFPILLDPGRKVNVLYQVDGIPKSFVYDRKGKLAAQAIDMRTQGQFLRMLGEAGLK